LRLSCAAAGASIICAAASQSMKASPLPMHSIGSPRGAIQVLMKSTAG
jgi:hypothetical protein